MEETLTNLILSLFYLIYLDKIQALHPCFVCKQEHCSRTRPLEKVRAQQYGIPEESIPSGARVCNNCQCKSVKSR